MAILTLFTQHSRSWQQSRYVYPVVSRRSKGLSIGVNLNPDKVCNFDCVYCSVDRKTPPTVTEVDLDVLRSELEHLVQLAATKEIWRRTPFDQAPAHLRRWNDVAFSGDGEPTSYPGFESACRMVVEVIERAGVFPPPKVVTITNATLLQRPGVAKALEFLDRHNGEIWAKLEAGTEGYYREVERTSIPLARVLENILAAGRVRPIVIQSLFMRLHEQGPPASEVEAYVRRLKELLAEGCQIKLVQVYTVARETAESWCTPLPAAELDAISELVRSETGLAVETYYGPS